LLILVFRHLYIYCIVNSSVLVRDLKRYTKYYVLVQVKYGYELLIITSTTNLIIELRYEISLDGIGTTSKCFIESYQALMQIQLKLCIRSMSLSL
jgi:hypothetical protein